MKTRLLPRIASGILLFVIMLTAAAKSVSAGTVTINSIDNAFAVVLNLKATSLNKINYSNSSFGYTVNFTYAISFTGNVPAGFSFYNIAGTFNTTSDGKGSFPLPTSGGTGTTVSYLQTHGDFSKFNSATPASLGVSQALITVEGPGISATAIPVDLVNTPGVLNPVPLPVKVHAFTATPSNKGVQIAWETVEETQVQSFTIDRSTDGKQWEAIATVAPKGVNTSGASYYEVTDRVISEGVRYYRLSETDINGTVTYYNTVVVRNGLAKTVPQLFPNPNTGNTIYFTGLEGQGNWQLSIMGAGAQNRGTFSVGNGSVTLPELPAGLYFLSLRSNVTGVVTTFRYSKL